MLHTRCEALGTRWGLRDMRTKVCKVCRQQFEPFKPMQSVCSPECALSLAKSARAKAEKVRQVKERKADAAKRERMKTKGQWVAEAQAAFNAYIRLRDQGKPCICCGRPTAGDPNSVDAGHYRSRGSAPHLRFDERNTHSQLKRCNRYHFDIAGYRSGLIERIGLDKVQALEADQTPKHYTVDDLRAIRDTYRAKARELKKIQ